MVEEMKTQFTTSLASMVSMLMWTSLLGTFPPVHKMSETKIDKDRAPQTEWSLRE